MAHIYKKIIKRNHVSYFYVQNRINSTKACIVADLHNKKGYETEFEAVIAWCDLKTGLIEWADEYELVTLGSRMTIRNFVMKMLIV